jgi:hypothetical protein
VKPPFQWVLAVFCPCGKFLNLVNPDAFHPTTLKKTNEKILTIPKHANISSEITEQLHY